jgi:predicted O-methyltransferase YrrM
MSTEERWTAVDQYLTGLFVAPDPALDAALERSRGAGLPPINVSPNEGKLLHLLARSIRAQRILEIGTLGGYSTIWLARALPPTGRLITLEANPLHADVARENLARANVADTVEIRVGRAIETLPQLESERAGPFDLIFIDADKPSNPDYLAWSLRLARPGTMIIADNVVRSGEVLDATSADASVRGIRRFNEMLAREPRVSATAIQTVGSKGHDGFALAVVLA